MPRFLLNALLFAGCLFVNFIQNPLAKSIAKRLVIIFKHAVAFLHHFHLKFRCGNCVINQTQFCFFVNCTAQRFSEIFCRQQIQYNVLHFLYTPLSFYTFSQKVKLQ